MPIEKPTFEWAETTSAVTVRLPAPPPEPPSMRWTTAVVGVLALLLLAFTIMLAWRAIAEGPADDTFWWMFAVVTAVDGCLLWVAMAQLRRDARAPGRASEPTVVCITGEELRIERAGRDRDMDYSWKLSEIADIRLCNAAPDRIFVSARAVLEHAMSNEEVIRVSIEHPSGEIDDMIITSVGRDWADALETRLRAHLGLSSDAAGSREPRRAG
jgi:hypothetical protein